MKRKACTAFICLECTVVAKRLQSARVTTVCRNMKPQPLREIRDSGLNYLASTSKLTVKSKTYVESVERVEHLSTDEVLRLNQRPQNPQGSQASPWQPAEALVPFRTNTPESHNPGLRTAHLARVHQAEHPRSGLGISTGGPVCM